MFDTRKHETIQGTPNASVALFNPVPFVGMLVQVIFPLTEGFSLACFFPLRPRFVRMLPPKYALCSDGVSLSQDLGVLEGYLQGVGRIFAQGMVNDFAVYRFC